MCLQTIYIKFNISRKLLTFIGWISMKTSAYSNPRFRRLIIQSKQRGTGHQIGSLYFLLVNCERKNRNKISFNIKVKTQKSSKLNFHGRKNFHNFPARLIYISLLFLYRKSQHNSIWISQQTFFSVSYDFSFYVRFNPG